MRTLARCGSVLMLLLLGACQSAHYGVTVGAPLPLAELAATRQRFAGAEVQLVSDYVAPTVPWGVRAGLVGQWLRGKVADTNLVMLGPAIAATYDLPIPSFPLYLTLRTSVAGAYARFPDPALSGATTARTTWIQSYGVGAGRRFGRSLFLEAVPTWNLGGPDAHGFVPRSQFQLPVRFGFVY